MTNGLAYISERTNQLRYANKDNNEEWLQQLSTYVCLEPIKRGMPVSIALKEDIARVETSKQVTPNSLLNKAESFIVPTDTSKHKYCVGIALETITAEQIWEGNEFNKIPIHIQNVGNFIYDTYTVDGSGNAEYRDYHEGTDFDVSDITDCYIPSFLSDYKTNIGKTVWVGPNPGELVIDERLAYNAAHNIIKIGHISDAFNADGINDANHVGSIEIQIEGDVRGLVDATQFELLIGEETTIPKGQPIVFSLGTSGSNKEFEFDLIYASNASSSIASHTGFIGIQKFDGTTFLYRTGETPINPAEEISNANSIYSEEDKLFFGCISSEPTQSQLTFDNETGNISLGNNFTTSNPEVNGEFKKQNFKASQSGQFVGGYYSIYVSSGLRANAYITSDLIHRGSKLNAGKAVLADIRVPELTNVVGLYVSKEADYATAGDTITLTVNNTPELFIKNGLYKVNGNYFTPGSTYYLGYNGHLTTNPLASVNRMLEIGYAIDERTLLLNIKHVDNFFSNELPIGYIKPMNGSEPEFGFLEMDGITAHNKSQYEDLYARLKVMFNNNDLNDSGDTFIIPAVTYNKGNQVAYAQIKYTNNIFNGVEKARNISKKSSGTIAPVSSLGQIEDTDVTDLITYGPDYSQTEFGFNMEDYDIKFLVDLGTNENHNWTFITPGFHLYNNTEYFGFNYKIFKNDENRFILRVITDGNDSFDTNVLGICYQKDPFSPPVSLAGKPYKIAIYKHEPFDRQFDIGNLINSSGMVTNAILDNTDQNAQIPTATAIKNYFAHVDTKNTVQGLKVKRLDKKINEGQDNNTTAENVNFETGTDNFIPFYEVDEHSNYKITEGNHSQVYAPKINNNQVSGTDLLEDNLTSKLEAAGNEPQRIVESKYLPESGKFIQKIYSRFEDNGVSSFKGIEVRYDLENQKVSFFTLGTDNPGPATIEGNLVNTSSREYKNVVAEFDTDGLSNQQITQQNPASSQDFGSTDKVSALQTLSEIPLAVFSYKNETNKKKYFGIITERLTELKNKLDSYITNSETQSPKSIVIGNDNYSNSETQTLDTGITYTYSNKQLTYIIKQLHMLTNNNENAQNIISSIGLLFEAAKETQERLLAVEASTFGKDSPTIPGNPEPTSELPPVETGISQIPTTLGLNRLIRALSVEVFGTADPTNWLDTGDDGISEYNLSRIDRIDRNLCGDNEVSGDSDNATANINFDSAAKAKGTSYPNAPIAFSEISQNEAEPLPATPISDNGNDYAVDPQPITVDEDNPPEDNPPSVDDENDPQENGSDNSQEGESGSTTSETPSVSILPRRDYYTVTDDNPFYDESDVTKNDIDFKEESYKDFNGKSNAFDSTNADDFNGINDAVNRIIYKLDALTTSINGDADALRRPELLDRMRDNIETLLKEVFDTDYFDEATLNDSDSYKKTAFSRIDTLVKNLYSYKITDDLPTDSALLGTVTDIQNGEFKETSRTFNSKKLRIDQTSEVDGNSTVYDDTLVAPQSIADFAYGSIIDIIIDQLSGTSDKLVRDNPASNTRESITILDRLNTIDSVLDQVVNRICYGEDYESYTQSTYSLDNFISVLNNYLGISMAADGTTNSDRINLTYSTSDNDFPGSFENTLAKDNPDTSSATKSVRKDLKGMKVHNAVYDIAVRLKAKELGYKEIQEKIGEMYAPRNIVYGTVKDNLTKDLDIDAGTDRVKATDGEPNNYTISSDLEALLKMVYGTDNNGATKINHFNTSPAIGENFTSIDGSKSNIEFLFEELYKLPNRYFIDPGDSTKVPYDITESANNTVDDKLDSNDQPITTYYDFDEPDRNYFIKTNTNNDDNRTSLPLLNGGHISDFKSNNRRNRFEVIEDAIAAIRKSIGMDYSTDASEYTGAYDVNNSFKVGDPSLIKNNWNYNITGINDGINTHYTLSAVKTNDSIKIGDTPHNNNYYNIINYVLGLQTEINDLNDWVKYGFSKETTQSPENCIYKNIPGTSSVSDLYEAFGFNNVNGSLEDVDTNRIYWHNDAANNGCLYEILLKPGTNSTIDAYCIKYTTGKRSGALDRLEKLEKDIYGYDNCEDIIDTEHNDYNPSEHIDGLIEAKSKINEFKEFANTVVDEPNRFHKQCTFVVNDYRDLYMLLKKPDTYQKVVDGVLSSPITLNYTTVLIKKNKDEADGSYNIAEFSRLIFSNEFDKFKLALSNAWPQGDTEQEVETKNSYNGYYLLSSLDNLGNGNSTISISNTTREIYFENISAPILKCTEFTSDANIYDLNISSTYRYNYTTPTSSSQNTNNGTLLIKTTKSIKNLIISNSGNQSAITIGDSTGTKSFNEIDGLVIQGAATSIYKGNLLKNVNKTSSGDITLTNISEIDNVKSVGDISIPGTTKLVSNIKVVDFTASSTDVIKDINATGNISISDSNKILNATYGGNCTLSNNLIVDGLYSMGNGTLEVNNASGYGDNNERNTSLNNVIYNSSTTVTIKNIENCNNVKISGEGVTLENGNNLNNFYIEETTDQEFAFNNIKNINNLTYVITNNNNNGPIFDSCEKLSNVLISFTNYKTCNIFLNCKDISNIKIEGEADGLVTDYPNFAFISCENIDSVEIKGIEYHGNYGNHTLNLGLFKDCNNISNVKDDAEVGIYENIYLTDRNFMCILGSSNITDCDFGQLSVGYCKNISNVRASVFSVCKNLSNCSIEPSEEAYAGFINCQGLISCEGNHLAAPEGNATDHKDFTNCTGMGYCTGSVDAYTCFAEKRTFIPDSEISSAGSGVTFPTDINQYNIASPAPTGGWNEVRQVT